MRLFAFFAQRFPTCPKTLLCIDSIPLKAQIFYFKEYTSERKFPLTFYWFDYCFKFGLELKSRVISLERHRTQISSVIDQEYPLENLVFMTLFRLLNFELILFQFAR